MNAACWSKIEHNMVLDLIRSVKQNRFIWDFKQRLNKSKPSKQKFWTDLAFELNNKYNPIVKTTCGDVSRIWNALRSRFSIHYKRKVNHPEHVTSWRYYKKLEFLIPCIKLQDPIQKDPIINKRKKKPYKDVKPISDKSTNGLNNELDKIIDYKENYELLRESPVKVLKPNRIENAEVDDVNDVSSSDNHFTVKHENEAQYMLVIPIQDEIKKTDCLDVNPLNPIPNSTMLNNQHVEECNSQRTAVYNNTNAESSVEVNTNKIAERPIINVNNALGFYVASEIAQLDPDLQINAKRQINNILMELLNEQLRRRLS